MDLLRPRLLALLLAALTLRALAAEKPAPWILPPIDGELAGEFTPLLLPGAPPVRWKLTIHTAKPHERTVEGAIDGTGLKLRGGAVLDPHGEGTWTLREAAIDLAEWFGWLAPRLLPSSVGTNLSGALTVRGDGTWRRGAVGGRAEIELRDGRFEDPGRKLVLEGLALRMIVEDIPTRRTAAAQVLTWQSGHYDAVPFGSGRVEFALDGETIRINAMTLAILGGEMLVGAMEWSASRPQVSFTAQMKGVDISQVLSLLPPVLSAAQGRLDGRIALQRDEAGIQIGVGQLSLRPGETAELRLAPSPGLLSSQLPAMVRQHYPGLERMETGGIPLRADILEVTLDPAGDAQGRTAAIHIEGGPADPALKSPVVLQVNVRGPLDSVVKFGTNPRLRFGGSP